MRIIERRARKFERPSGLERDGALALSVVEANEVSVVLDALPAKMRLHPFEEGPNPPLAIIRDGSVICAIKWDLLVLSADPEWACRLASGLKPGDERVARFDNFTIDDVASHKGDHPNGRRTGEPAR